MPVAKSFRTLFGLTFVLVVLLGCTPAATPTPIPTLTFTPTQTLAPTVTPTFTNTPTPTRTSTPTLIPTNTRTLTPMPTQTFTPTYTPTPTIIPTLTSQEEEHVKQLLEQLKSGDQDTVEQAHMQLSRLSKQLSQADVLALVHIMRTTGVVWDKVVNKTSHCTDYARRSTAWYAAFLITGLGMDKSPYVDMDLQLEAMSIMSKSETRYRVTEPGWV